MTSLFVSITQQETATQVNGVFSSDEVEDQSLSMAVTVGFIHATIAVLLLQVGHCACEEGGYCKIFKRLLFSLSFTCSLLY